jgi:hypothetical protein
MTSRSPRLMCPSTFSKKQSLGRRIRIPSAINGQRWRGSSVPSRFPAAENGWQGYPPVRMSTRSRNSAHGKDLRFVQIGAASMSPASIFATKFAQQKASTSQRATVRRFRITRWSPSSMPPYPAQSPRCVIVLVVSTLFVFLLSIMSPNLRRPLQTLPASPRSV